MKKIIIYSILTYLFFTINSNAIRLNSEEKDVQDGNILKVGVLLPLSGENGGRERELHSLVST